MVQERASWKIKDTAVLEELIALMNLSQSENQTLAALTDTARATAPAMTADFYDRLFKHSNTAEYFEGIGMERLHSMVGDWFVDIFAGPHDANYAEKRLKIGKIHVDIGLPVRYPLAMMDVVLPHGETVAQTSPTPDEAVRAFRKVMSLDIAIFNQAYEDTQLKHLSELVGGEMLARRLLVGIG